MKKSRSFSAGGFDRLEGRVVLSHTATGVIGGHKAHLVAADFAGFQSAYNSTVVPMIQQMQAAQKADDGVQSDLDQEGISNQVATLVNGLGDQLARQLHKKMYARIRDVVTGAPSPTTVGLVSGTPSAGSLQATLSAMPTDMMANTSAADAVISVFQNDLIDGNLTPRSRGDFVNFESTLNTAVTPTSDQSLTTPQLDAAVTTAVNGLGTQLSKDLGAPAVSDIQSKITGATGSSGVTLAATSTPTPGSLASVLDSMSQDDFYDWDFINDLAMAYAGSSTNF